MISFANIGGVGVSFAITPAAKGAADVTSAAATGQALDLSALNGSATSWELTLFGGAAKQVYATGDKAAKANAIVTYINAQANFSASYDGGSLIYIVRSGASAFTPLLEELATLTATIDNSGATKTASFNISGFNASSGRWVLTGDLSRTETIVTDRTATATDLANWVKTQTGWTSTAYVSGNTLILKKDAGGAIAAIRFSEPSISLCSARKF